MPGKRLKVLCALSAILALLSAAAPTLATGALPQGDRNWEAIGPEVALAARQKGRLGIEAVMRRYGWTPAGESGGDGSREVGIEAVDPSGLYLRLYAWRNRYNTQVAIYGEYTWKGCENRHLRGSYDVMGLDWKESALTLLEIKSDDTAFIWYRGENPFQQSVVFNIKERYTGPWPGTCRYGGYELSHTGWMVFQVPRGAAGKTLQFNLRYDHTYLTRSASAEWSAGLEWDTSLRGNQSYKILYQTHETSWSKGRFLSFTW